MNVWNLSSQDTGLWTSVKLSHNLDHQFTLQAALGHRLKEEFTSWNESFANMGLLFQHNSLTSAFIYRLSGLNLREAGNIHVHRLSWEINYNHEFSVFIMEFRSRFQARYFETNPENSLITPRSHLRNRIKSEINIPFLPVNPSLSYEVFYRLNNGMPNNFEQQRIIMGVDYQMKADQAFQIYLLYLERMNVENPSENYIVGLGYSVYI